jgi:hypothetical protein
MSNIGGKTLDWSWHARQLGHEVKTVGLKIAVCGPQGQPYEACSWHVCSCGERSEPTCNYVW